MSQLECVLFIGNRVKKVMHIYKKKSNGKLRALEKRTQLKKNTKSEKLDKNVYKWKQG